MDHQTLTQYVARLKNTQNTPQLQKEFSEIIQEIGFQQFAYMRFHMENINAEQSIYTYSEAWKILYFKRDYHLIDPIFSRAFAENVPFFWSAEQYGHDPELINFFSEANKYGLYQGITIPLKSIEKKKAILTCASANAKQGITPVFDDEVMLISIQVLAETFHQMAIVFSDVYDHHLKPREQQILQLSALGLPTDKTAIFLGLNKDYVHEVISNALKRLGANNRVAAVYRSQELGFLKNLNKTRENP